MDIRELRIVLRARNFDRTCEFYGETLALPKIRHWDRENGCGALYQAGGGLIEIHGRRGESNGERDEAFEYQGPEHKMTVTMVVPSAERAYEELQFRERNIPGGLKQAGDGTLIFETHDPDGVKVIYCER